MADLSCRLVILSFSSVTIKRDSYPSGAAKLEKRIMKGLRTYTPDMTIKRLDDISVVVDDPAAAIAFFTALAMTLQGEAPIEGHAGGPH